MTSVVSPGDRGGAVVNGAAGDGARDRGLWVVLGLMALYSALHIGFRLLASSSLGEDDPIENLVAQELRAIYDPRQPPLYTWVLHGVQALTGPNITSFLAIKYLALIGTGAFLYLTARRAIGAGVLALMSVESLALIYQMSWRFHEGFTHQVGAMIAVAATMWAAARVVDRRRSGDFALLGIMAGLGCLTEPIFAVFLLALLAAMLLEPVARGLFADARIGLVAVPVAAGAGFYLWHALDAVPLVDLVGRPGVPSGRDALAGLWNAGRAPLFYLSPLILILPLLFPRMLGRMLRDLGGALRPAAMPGRDAGPADEGLPGTIERIVLRTSVIAFLVSTAGAAALGLKGYASHVFMPLYITSVVWLMGTVTRSRPTEAALTRFGRVALFIAVFALLARLANMFVLDPVCKICRWGIPYPGLAAELRTLGSGDATIVTLDHELGGNLRAMLPDNRVVLYRGGVQVPRDGRIDGSRLMLVWNAATPPDRTAAAFGPLLSDARTLDRAANVRVPWRHLWRPGGYRTTEWRVLVVDGGGK